MRSPIVAAFMVLLLLPSALAEGLVFQDTLGTREAKLYQHGNLGYTIELVEITAKGEAVFLVNGKELTPPIAEGDEHELADGSEMEPTLIKTMRDTVKFIFSGSGKGALQMPDSQEYRAKSIPTQYNYTDETPRASPQPSSEATAPAPAPAPSGPRTVDVPNRTAESVMEKEVSIEAESETFSVGWLNSLWNWLKGLFS